MTTTRRRISRRMISYRTEIIGAVSMMIRAIASALFCVVLCSCYATCVGYTYADCGEYAVSFLFLISRSFGLNRSNLLGLSSRACLCSFKKKIVRSWKRKYSVDSLLSYTGCRTCFHIYFTVRKLLLHGEKNTWIVICGTKVYFAEVNFISCVNKISNISS